jgi:hypothetical protein
LVVYESTLSFVGLLSLSKHTLQAPLSYSSPETYSFLSFVGVFYTMAVFFGWFPKKAVRFVRMARFLMDDFVTFKKCELSYCCLHAIGVGPG